MVLRPPLDSIRNPVEQQFPGPLTMFRPDRISKGSALLFLMTEEVVGEAALHPPRHRSPSDMSPKSLQLMSEISSWPKTTESADACCTSSSAKLCGV